MLANSYYPSAAAVFESGKETVLLPVRPETIGPILDDRSSTKPLASFDAEIHQQIYPPRSFDHGPSEMPPKPEGLSDPYLYPMLTQNEKLRLTMLWYYTRDVQTDTEILGKIHEKVGLLSSLIGWEFAICGLLDNDTYERLATTKNLPLAILPRREATCSHTVQQSPGSVFFIPNMSDDWRFAESPHVTLGGLRSYAGVQLRCKVGDGQQIALGSLCVASNTPNEELGPAKLDILIKFADMLSEDIVTGFLRKRAVQQHENDNLLREAFLQSLRDPSDEIVLRVLALVFPYAQISLIPIETDSIQLQADGQSLEILLDAQPESSIWENHDVIDELLRTRNHTKMATTQPVRAIISKVRNELTNEALVVYVHDITRIFDDVDVRFVEGCAMVLRSIAQEVSLQEALRARERFMRGITHQLRTPIHGILGSVDLLADELSPSRRQDNVALSMDDVTARTLRMIKSSGRELMSTVNNVIKFNRWADSVTTSKTTNCRDLNKMESEILDEMSWLLPDEHLNRVSILFDNRIPIGAGTVEINQILVKDCLQSLVLNALQNTMRGSVTVTRSAAPDYSAIIFDVHDTGCGIELTNWARIFDAYEKIDTNSIGAGLGLTLSSQIATALGGSVTLVSSTPEKGSHFRAEFRNPGFSLRKDEHTTTDPAMCEFIDRFVVIHSDPPSVLDEHFADLLKARGMQPSDQVSEALTIVPFSPLSDQYQDMMNLATGSLVTISLVPVGADLDAASQNHPDVLFFSGPFTNDRLDEIFIDIRTACESRRPLPAPTPEQPTTFDEATLEIQSKLSTVSLQRSYSSTRNSIVSRGPISQCLLVDDNMVNLRILSMYCEKRKLPYKTARDGLQAIESYKAAAKETPINLILLDLQMPLCDGLRACEEIRAFEAEQDLRCAVIFIITGQDSPHDKDRSFEVGADKFYVKPLALKNLDRGLREYFSDLI